MKVHAKNNIFHLFAGLVRFLVEGGIEEVTDVWILKKKSIEKIWICFDIISLILAV